MTDIINLHDTLPLPPQPAGSAPALTATLVQDEQRIGFWPQYFGSIPQWIILEPTVFAWMGPFLRRLQRRYLEFLYAQQRWCVYGPGSGEQ